MTYKVKDGVLTLTDGKGVARATKYVLGESTLELGELRLTRLDRPPPALTGTWKSSADAAAPAWAFAGSATWHFTQDGRFSLKAADEAAALAEQPPETKAVARGWWSAVPARDKPASTCGWYRVEKGQLRLLFSDGRALLLPLLTLDGERLLIAGRELARG